jgi:hypothetical protein
MRWIGLLIEKVTAARFQMLLLFLTYVYKCLVVNVKLGLLNNINSLYLINVSLFPIGHRGSRYSPVIRPRFPLAGRICKLKAKFKEKCPTQRHILSLDTSNNSIYFYHRSTIYTTCD